MDLTSILAIIKAGAAALTGTAAEQFLQILEGFVQALPAIEKGWASAAPFIAALIKVIGNGGAPLAPDDWQSQLDMLQQQRDAVAAQVAADELAQPTS